MVPQYNIINQLKNLDKTQFTVTFSFKMNKSESLQWSKKAAVAPMGPTSYNKETNGRSKFQAETPIPKYCQV